MTNKIELLTKIQNGHVDDNCRKSIANTLGLLEGKFVKITIEERKSRRSLPQNKYWFSALEKYVTPKFREAGSNWDTWKIHEELMKELGYTEVLVKPTGEAVRVRRHSSDFNKMEFAEMVTRAVAHLKTEYDIDMLLPNEINQ